MAYEKGTVAGAVFFEVTKNKPMLKRSKVRKTNYRTNRRF